MKITDLIQDDKNFNKGSDFGKKLIKKSIKKFGAGRSILIDKNNNIIAGNKSVENAQEQGIDDVIIVETDGTKLVAVKRTDIDLKTKKGREMALADNASAKANIVFDAELIESEIDNAKEWLSERVVEKFDYDFEENTENTENKKEHREQKEIDTVPFYTNVKKSTASIFNKIKKTEKLSDAECFEKIVKHYDTTILG